MPKYFPPDHRHKKTGIPENARKPTFPGISSRQNNFSEKFLHHNFSQKILYISEKNF